MLRPHAERGDEAGTRGAEAPPTGIGRSAVAEGVEGGVVDVFEGDAGLGGGTAAVLILGGGVDEGLAHVPYLDADLAVTGLDLDGFASELSPGGAGAAEAEGGGLDMPRPLPPSRRREPSLQALIARKGHLWERARLTFWQEIRRW